MDLIHYDSPGQIRAFLEEQGLAMTKRFGQNFLINPGARKKLLDLLELREGETIWEIGPGLGAMTHMMLPLAGNLTVFEIDRGFCRILPEFFGADPRWTLVEGDFLKTWKGFWKENNTPDGLLGNLPYNVGSIMILALLKEGCLPKRMVFTVQKEVAQRMAASPGTKNYSSFSVLCQYQCDVEYLGDIQAGSFYPPPRVVSSMVRMIPHGRYPQEQREVFFALANDLFAARRKTVKNNLQKGQLAQKWGKELILSALEESGISGGARGEEFGIDEIFQLSNLVYIRVHS